VGVDHAAQRLNDIKHIVVLMMENRSFDHMLGHLSLEGMTEVNGLTGNEFNLGPDNKPIPITAFNADAHHVQREGEALQKKLDPDHSKKGVQIQLGPGYGTDPNETNQGFVKAFVESRKPEDDVGPELWMVPMGYYTSKDVPVYDHLAHHYCVCDAWHSSVPGDTWPNRLYSLAAREADKVHPSLLARLDALLPGHALKALEGAPIYDVPAFTRHLHDTQWRWYSHDPATLRAADGHYRDFHDIKRDNFAYFDRKKLSIVTEAAEALIVGHDSFLDDAAKGQLRDVSWIDPNFIDLDVLDPNSNDDHPPTDIRAGQAFVLELYEALRRSPAWEDTLLVIVYDEHGGFYDHVPPPAVDDDSGYATLGVRVPALIIGPRVEQHVCHDVFDHTTLIKTILTRFAEDPDQAIAQMPPRVAKARHLGVILADQPRTDIPAPDDARTAIEAWRSDARASRQAAATGEASPAPDGAGRDLQLHDFQDEFARFALAVRHAGLPSGQP
jgi:phospholipase C